MRFEPSLKGLRGELRALGSQIRVSAVSPAYVETDFVAQYHRSEDKAAEIFAVFPFCNPRISQMPSCVYVVMSPTRPSS